MAFNRALAEVGVEDVSGLTRWFPRELDPNPQGFFQAVYDALFALLNQKVPITALFCVQDSFAAAALQACDQMGVSIPDQMEIATFNGGYIHAFVPTKTVHSHRAARGHRHYRRVANREDSKWPDARVGKVKHDPRD